METIIAFLVRQFIFTLLAMVSLYLLVLTFGALPNYFEWNSTSTGVFGLFSNLGAIVMHTFWLDYRSKRS